MQDRLRAGILSTAAVLGINPLDLATAISYETAGTFDPSKSGPTTKWGQHRGLIQFGEPQAQKYGVDWSNPIDSQLGPQGAVANYLRDTGVKPGMGLLDIYSAINAGGVGPEYYGRSDAAAGGAPGTVRDKVEQQMADHRQKAAALLGGGAFEAGVMPVHGGASNSPPPPGQSQPFGSMAPMMAGQSTIPTNIAAYAASEEPKSLGDRLSAAAKAFEEQAPKPPRISPMGSAAETGNVLLKFLNSPTAADLLIAKRLRGVA